MDNAATRAKAAICDLDAYRDKYPDRTSYEMLLQCDARVKAVKATLEEITYIAELQDIPTLHMASDESIGHHILGVEIQPDIFPS